MLLIFGSEIFIDFSIKRGVRKLPRSFFLVEVGLPNNQSAAFVGRFENFLEKAALENLRACLPGERVILASGLP